VLKLLKILSWPFLVFVLVANAHTAYRALGWAVSHKSVYFPFVIGFFVYLIFAKLIVRKNITFLQTFTHELTHALVGLLFFRKIHYFHARGSGTGEILHSGTSNVFIALAPYCFPIYTFGLLLFRLLISDSSLRAFDIVVGMSAAFHFIAIKNDIGTYQTDIQRNGVIYSYLFIWGFILFHISLIVWSIPNNIEKAFYMWLHHLEEAYQWLAAI